MAGKCGKCSEEVTPTSDSLTCVECKVSFHLPCTGVKTTRNLGSKKLKWKCDQCNVDGVTETAFKSDLDASDNNAVLEAIYTMQNKITDKFDTVFDKLGKLSQDVETVKNTVQEVNQEIIGLKADNIKMREELDAVKAVNVGLTKEVSDLRASVRDMEQYSRINDLIITGVPVTTNENCLSIIANIAEVLGVEHHNYDISVAHRLQSRKDDPRHPPIVVRFLSRAVKGEWLAAKWRKKTLSTTELRGRLQEGEIYINEHLTPHTRQIFNRARQLVKNKEIFQVWTRDCKVFIRRTEGGKVIKVTHLQELD